MPDKYIVEPVINEEKDDVYFEVQMFTGTGYVTVYQNGAPLSFKLEKMADAKAEALNRLTRYNPLV